MCFSCFSKLLSFDMGTFRGFPGLNPHMNPSLWQKPQMHKTRPQSLEPLPPNPKTPSEILAWQCLWLPSRNPKLIAELKSRLPGMTSRFHHHCFRNPTCYFRNVCSPHRVPSPNVAAAARCQAYLSPGGASHRDGNALHWSLDRQIF